MRLVIRADANTRIGTGHLMRCLALAQAWKDSGGRVVFITACESAGLLQRLSDEGFQIITLERSYPNPGDWKTTSRVLSEHPDAWVVLDGYHFDPAYQHRIKEAGHSLLVIDDMAHLEHYYADIVLNQNLHAEQLNYPSEPYTRLLLGTQYVLLRREFLRWQGWKREIPEVARKVLVTMGGGDPDNVTLKVIRAVSKLEVDDLEIRVVVGPSNSHMGSLKKAVNCSPFTIHLLPAARNMPELMAWADVAVSGGGSTCWEMASMGLPNVIVVLANNQHPIAKHLGKMGASINIGWHESVSAKSVAKTLTAILNSRQQRIDMAEKGRNLVDGEGVERLCMILKGTKLRLRLVRDEDCHRLWEWANDPQVRLTSYSTEMISWEDHMEWFDGVTADPNCRIWIAVDNEDRLVGQIRFEACGPREAKIDVSIDRRFRRRGYGSMMIDLGVQAMFARTATQLLHAHIRQGNEVSIRAFERAEFVEQGLETISGVESYHYVRGRNDE